MMTDDNQGSSWLEGVEHLDKTVALVHAQEERHRQDDQRSELVPPSSSVPGVAVHLAKSYPVVVSALQGGGRGEFQRELERISLGDWARVSEADAIAAKVLLGVFEGRIVSAYLVDGYSRDDTDNRVRWTGSPADDFAGLIGTPLPGGGWVRGQARPIRKVHVERTPGVVDAATAMVDLALAASRDNLDPVRGLTQDLEAKIQVEVVSPKTVVVKVPLGIDVLVKPTGSLSSRAAPSDGEP